VGNGRQLSLGNDPLEFTWVSGFDIPSDVRVTVSASPVTAGLGYAALTVNGAQRLYSIDLTNGRAVSRGAVATAL